MNGVNKVILIGTLGKDPDVRYTQSGDPVANLSVATSEKWKDQSGQPKEETEWHRVVMFKKLAGIANDYLYKGAKVYLEGKIKTRKWQDQNGQDRYTTEIHAFSMQMLGDNKKPQKEPQSAPEPQGDFDDDIPFAGYMKANEYLV